MQFLLLLFTTVSFLPLRQILNYDYATSHGWFIEGLAASFYASDLIFPFVLSLLVWLERRNMKFITMLGVVLLILSGWSFRGENSLLNLHSFYRAFEAYTLAVAFYLFRREHGFLKFMALTLIAMGIFQTLLGTYQVLTGHSLGFTLFGEQVISTDLPGIAKVDLPNGQKIVRSYGTFSHPNILGGFLVLSILSLLALTTPFALSFTTGVTSLVLFFGLFITFSRSAYLAAFLLLLFLSVGASARRHIIKLLLLFSIFITVITTAHDKLGSGLISRISPPPTDNFQIDRAVLREKAMPIINENFLFGIGNGRYISNILYFVSLETEQNRWLLDYPHSILILSIAEWGITGIFVLIFIVCYYSDFCSNKYRTIIVFSLLPIFFYDHYLLTNQPGRIIFVIMLTLAPEFYKLISIDKSNGGFNHLLSKPKTIINDKQ